MLSCVWSHQGNSFEQGGGEWTRPTVIAPRFARIRPYLIPEPMKLLVNCFCTMRDQDDDYGTVTINYRAGRQLIPLRPDFRRLHQQSEPDRQRTDLDAAGDQQGPQETRSSDRSPRRC